MHPSFIPSGLLVRKFYVPAQMNGHSWTLYKRMVFRPYAIVCGYSDWLSVVMENKNSDKVFGDFLCGSNLLSIYLSKGFPAVYTNIGAFVRMNSHMISQVSLLCESCEIDDNRSQPRTTSTRYHRVDGRGMLTLLTEITHVFLLSRMIAYVVQERSFAAERFVAKRTASFLTIEYFVLRE